jgi:hypothetical protein
MFHVPELARDTLMSDNTDANPAAALHAQIATLHQDRAARVALPPLLAYTDVDDWAEDIASKRENFGFDNYVALIADALRQAAENGRAEAVAALTVCQQQLAECYRLTGADPDGNTDAALAPFAVSEVKRLRVELDEETDRVDRVAEARDKAEAERDQAVAALADQRQLVARLRTYVQHDNNCKMILCVECHGSRGNGRHREDWIPGSGVYWHEFTPQGACTCGLAALVAELEPV